MLTTLFLTQGILRFLKIHLESLIFPFSYRSCSLSTVLIPSSASNIANFKQWGRDLPPDCGHTSAGVYPGGRYLHSHYTKLKSRVQFRRLNKGIWCHLKVSCKAPSYQSKKVWVSYRSVSPRTCTRAIPRGPFQSILVWFCTCQATQYIRYLGISTSMHFYCIFYSSEPGLQSIQLTRKKTVAFNQPTVCSRVHPNSTIFLTVLVTTQPNRTWLTFAHILLSN